MSNEFYARKGLIVPNGNVGIGTISPSSKLAVNGDITILTGSGIYFNTSANTGNSSIMCQGGGSMSLRAYGTEMIGLNENTTLLFSTSGLERMRISSAGNTQPGADNAYSLGVSGTRWSAVWAANGTIQTSDEREKKDIIDSDLGLDFISKLRPVSFKWKVGQNIITSEPDGIDEDGKEKTKTVIIPREGIRTHYGLIAQEVETLLNGKDFGGFIHDSETDIKGLRYDQFVPILIKGMQEQQTQIESLKQEIETLKNK